MLLKKINIKVHYAYYFTSLFLINRDSCSFNIIFVKKKKNVLHINNKVTKEIVILNLEVNNILPTYCLHTVDYSYGGLKQ